MKFDELGLPAPLLKAVETLGFTEPTPVQEQVIPALMGQEIDLIALAQTGTGKTAAYGLPIIANCVAQVAAMGRSQIPKALVLCPTRELCLQIADDLQSFSRYLDEMSILPVYGGSSIDVQIRSLKKGVDIIVATPGRLIDLMERKVADLSEVSNIILDEADEMLNMGFSESLETILAALPEERHLLLFSATMSKEISRIAGKTMNSPKEIVIGQKNETNKNIRHFHYIVSAKHKYLALKRIADFYPEIYGIVFCRTRKETKEVAERLINDGYNAESLHGELSQAQRDYVMQKFRIRSIRLLVATDVAARGLDVNDLSHVIHYGLPDEIESYTHRSGRTARAGKSGISIAICHTREKNRLKDIEKIINTKIERAYIPNAKEICEKQLYNHADRLERLDAEIDERLAEILPGILKKLSWMDREDLVRRMLSLEAGRILAYYQDAEDIEEADEKGRMPRTSGEREDSGRQKRGRNTEAEPGMARLRINFGKRDSLYPNRLIELVNKCVPGRVNIGKIDLFRDDAFFEVDEHEASDVIESMNAFEVDGRAIRVDYAIATDAEDKKTSGRGCKYPGSRVDRGGAKEFKNRRDKRRDGEVRGPKRLRPMPEEDEAWAYGSRRSTRGTATKKTEGRRAKTDNSKGKKRGDKEPFYSKFGK